MKVKSESEVAQSCRLFETPWTAAYQGPASMGFSRQEYWSRVPLPSPVVAREMQIKKHSEVPLHTKPNRKEWKMRVVDEYGADEPVFKVEIETLYRRREQTYGAHYRNDMHPLATHMET